MPRRPALTALTAALASAGNARDWVALDRAVGALAAQLQLLAAAGPWNAQETLALAALRAQHDKAAALCAAELDVLEARMQHMQTNKAGYIAYALDNDTDDDRHQATP
jgi:cell division protein FtsB